MSTNEEIKKEGEATTEPKPEKEDKKTKKKAKEEELLLKIEEIGRAHV